MNSDFALDVQWMALGSCFRQIIQSIMWSFNQRLKPCSLRWELVNHPKQWKQHCQGCGTVTSPGLSSSWLNWRGELWCERLMDVTDNNDRSWQELPTAPRKMAEFHGWFRGSDERDGQTSLKRSFGTLGKTNSSWIPTSATGCKTEINCATNGVRNTMDGLWM